MNRTPTYLTLYGMKLSWYSTKVRAYLQFKGIDFFERSPTLLDYYWTIKNKFGDAAVPVVVTPDGEWIQDSSIIIERLETLNPQPSITPENPVQRVFASLIELWADEFWLTAGVHTRWSFPEQNYPLWEAELGPGFAPGFPRFIQRALARIPKKMMVDYLKVLGIEPKQVPTIDRWIDALLDALNAHFESFPYLLGSRASIADFALFGPLDGHMYRDVSSRVPLIDSRPFLHAWIQRLSTRKPQPWPGDFPDTDQLPATLQPIIRSIFDEMTPYLDAMSSEVRRMLPTLKPGARLPRFTPYIAFPFGDAPQFQRQGHCYALWMAQRVLDQLQHMPKDDADRVRACIIAMGGSGFLELDIPRLRRSGLHAALE